MTAHTRSHVFVIGSYVQANCWYVDRLPTPGETLSATQLHIEAGGKGLNVTLAMQRLGERVVPLIACGNDDAGDALLTLLSEEKVNSTHIVRVSGHSGMGSGHIAQSGENQIVVFPGANTLLDLSHVNAASEYISTASMLYAQFEAAIPAVEHAFQIAAEARVTTVLNPSPWQPVPEKLRSTTQILIVNRAEASALIGVQLTNLNDVLGLLTGAGALVVLHGLMGRWPHLKQLIVTLGAQGSLGFQQDVLSGQWRGWWVEACSAAAVVDCVGAGDSFAAAYIVGLMSEYTVFEAMQRAHLCSAHVIAGQGVLKRLPTLQQQYVWLQEARLPVVQTLDLNQ